MKFLLINLLFILPFSGNAAELSPITLITPVSYTKNSSTGKLSLSAAKSNTSTKFSKAVEKKVAEGKNVVSEVMVTAASTFEVNIEKKVRAKIEPYRKDLQNYFPRAGELDAMIKSTIAQGMKNHLSEMNDDNMIVFYKFLGNELIGKFANRILEKEGVDSPERRALWVNKLMEPFNACINTSSNSQFDADHCIEALTGSLVPSIGIGIVYELSKSNLNSALEETKRAPFNIEQVNMYKSCITKTKASATDVVNCALTIMKDGVWHVTNLSFNSTVEGKSSSNAKTLEIKKAVWPAFDSCIQAVGTRDTKTPYRDQFLGCIDVLVQNTGTLIVADKISHTQALQDALPAKEINKLASEKSAQFKKCAGEQRSKGMRQSGILDISPCENAVTNEVTYKAVSETFKKTGASTSPKNKTLALKTGNDGIQLLNKCWNNNQAPEAREACLRKTIVAFSSSIATIKLNDSIPDDMADKAELAKSSVNELAKCIDRELPRNISESNDLTKRIDGCSGKTTRSVALKVANQQIRQTAKDNLSLEATDTLAKNLVEGEFAKCIGASPGDNLLDNCSNVLILKAAKQITESSFPIEVNAYLKKSGGASALGLTDQQVQKFVSSLTLSAHACIDQKTVTPAMDKVNACTKSSIKSIAFFFGDAQFKKSIGSLYRGREADQRKIEGIFQKSLSDCLGTRDGKTFSITDYTNNLYTCSDKVSHSLTMMVGEDQVNSSLEQYLKDRPGMDLKTSRASVRASVLGNFKTCMGKTTNTTPCIDSLKREATKSIVVLYGRAEIKTQLNADQTPPELAPLESDFLACMDSTLEGDALSAHIDECNKNFALSFAKDLGNLKLNYLLKQALGTADYNAQKREIDKSLAKYNDCLDSLKKYSMEDGLTSRLSVCTDDLTNRGMALVRVNIKNWMSSDQKDAATLLLKQQFSDFLPCLSALLPVSPYNQHLQDQLDSSVKPLAVLLAHYIEYNPENAQQTFEGVLKKLSVDLNDVAATQKAKKELLDFLYQSKGLDQFIKAVVRGTVKDALADVSLKDVPQDLRDVLLKKENFEEMFNSAEGSRIKDLIMEKLLIPALLEGSDLRGITFKSNMEAIKDHVVKLLINAPSFGEQAIKMSIDMKMRDLSGITRFFAKALYGGDALQWEKVRMTSEGKKAEAYIKDNLLTPKFKGVVQTAEEQKQINDEAERLVKKAVKSHG